MDQILERILADSDVSDLHLEEGSAPWVRSAGALSRIDGQPLTAKQLKDFLASHEDETGIAAEQLESRLAKRGDLDFACTVAGARLRGNVFRANGHLCMALRRIPRVPTDAAVLGLPPRLFSLINRAKGMLLVTGPTGSGKSTTLAACIEYLNQHVARHVITIEDPVEYLFEQRKSLIQQRQVGRDAPSFAAALRAALREDPDVIMLGELRDTETMETALHAANTGHLVLGTLHTSGARQTIERIGMLFTESTRANALQSLSSVLIGVISQCLVPRARGSGRVLSYELMLNTQAVRQAIKDCKPNAIFSAMETGRRDGHVLLNQHLADLVRAGEVAKEDALYITYDPAGLEKELNYARM